MTRRWFNCIRTVSPSSSDINADHHRGCIIKVYYQGSLRCHARRSRLPAIVHMSVRVSRCQGIWDCGLTQGLLSSYISSLKADWPGQIFADHEFHENCHSVTSYFLKKDSKWCCDTSTPESIHTKDESKRGSAFAFIFGVNWPVQSM